MSICLSGVSGVSGPSGLTVCLVRLPLVRLVCQA